MTAPAVAVVHDSAELPGGTMGFASWSPDRRYRWTLRRIWGGRGPDMVWVMLNPSTAGAFANDQTVTRCMWFARREGCASMTVTNLFALASTDPRQLLTAANPVGWANDQAISGACTGSELDTRRPRIVVVAWGAWGAHPKLRRRAAHVMGILDGLDVPYSAFGLTAGRHPVHPSRLPRTAALRVLSVGLPA